MARQLLLAGLWSGSAPVCAIDAPMDLTAMKERLTRFRACELAERDLWLAWPIDDRPEPGRDGVADAPGLRVWACDFVEADPYAAAAGRPFDAELMLGDDVSLERTAVLLMGLLIDRRRDA